MGIEHQINNIRRELNELERSVALQDQGDNFPYESVRKRNVFAKQQGMIMSNPEDEIHSISVSPENPFGEFGVQLNNSFMEPTGGIFDMSVVEVGGGTFGVEFTEGQEVSVGVAEINMELASMESSNHDAVTDVGAAENSEDGETGEAEAGSGEGGESGE